MSFIAAVIVTFNPDLKNITRLVSDLNESGVICCVVDNSEHCVLENIFDKNNLFIPLGENLGIASAQNIGIRKCISVGAGKIIFFDQDSVIEPDLIERLDSTFSDTSVNIAAPVFFDIQKGFGYELVSINSFGLRKKIKPEDIEEFVDVNVVISSGTLVKSSVFDVVGLLNEDLFIDYVDTEWCLRCAAKGLFIRVNAYAQMRHAIGDQSVRFLGYRVPVHGALRRYYRVRNSFLLFRIPAIPKLVAIREVVFSFIHQLIIIFHAKDKVDYFKLYLRAVRDGILGVTGRIR